MPRKIHSVVLGVGAITAFSLAFLMVRDMRSQAGVGLFEPTPYDSTEITIARIGLGLIVFSVIIWPWHRKTKNSL